MAKTVLKETSENIIEKGRMVYTINDDLKENRHKMTLKEAKTKTNIMQKKIQEVEENSLELKEMLEIYERESNFENENPLVYLMYGTLGVLVYVLGFFLLIHNYYLLNSNHKMTDEFYHLTRKFLGQGVVFFLILLIYLTIIVAIFIGYQKISELVPDWFIKKYHIEEDKTWTDEFLAVSNLFMLATFSTLVAFARQFSSLFNSTGIFYWFNLHLPSVVPYNYLIYSYYPNAMYIIFFLVGFFIVFFELSPKEKLWKLIREKKEDLKEKQEVIKDNPGLL